MHSAVTPMLHLAQRLAAELGDDWQAEPGGLDDGSDAHLYREGGESIWITCNRYRTHGRIEIDGAHGILRDYWPRDQKTHRPTEHVITVSASKSPAQTARDIRRRLLPGYREAFAEAAARKRAHDDAEHHRHTLIAAIRCAIGGTPAPACVGEDIWFGHRSSPLDRLRAEVTVSGASSPVDFDVHVPSALATAFAHHIAAFPTEVGER